jgi:hypothetical protein
MNAKMVHQNSLERYSGYIGADLGTIRRQPSGPLVRTVPRLGADHSISVEKKPQST